MFKLNVGMVLGTLLLAAPAWSSLISVSNFSFEDALVSPTSTVFGPYTLNIPSWFTTATAGTFQPNTNPAGPFALNATAGGGLLATGSTGVVDATSPVSPTNAQMAFLSNGGTMYQDLGLLGASGSFSVTVDVGHRTDVK